jgi:small-conductance mechanosensitive channel
MDLTDITQNLPVGAMLHVFVVVALIVIFILYKMLSRLIRRTAERLGMEPHARNALRLLLRVLTVFSALYLVFSIYNISTTVFVSGSALVGALLGFGASQTINNVVAGFYVLITQPFKIKDYVKIGDLEGQVEEISINYTTLYTPTFNVLKVPNTQVMNSRILNMTHEGYIKNTFTVGFSLDHPQDVIQERCLIPAVNEFHEKFGDGQLRSPEVFFDNMDRLGLTFLIRFFIPKGDAKLLYVLRPEFLELINKYWNELKMQPA